MTLTDIRQILTREGILLTRSLGQSFLHDGNQLRRIIEAAEIRSTDKVLEIGPGLGPLTELLLERAGTVLALEVDVRLYGLLKKRFQNEPKLDLRQADALKFLSAGSDNWTEWKVVSNLPYSVASPILVELSRVDTAPERMTVTLQKEVAERLAARPGTEDYGLLTLLVQLVFEPASLLRIPAGSFFPAPNVDSACLTLVRRKQPLLPPDEVPVYRKIVKRGLSERRKMMFKLLKADWPVEHLHQSFREMGISEQIRAEKLSVEQFVQLTKLLLRHAST